MIRFLQHADIDFEKWDNCIDGAPNGILYAYSWYLDMVAPGWCALIEDEYEAVMPLPVKEKWGFQYAYQPFFSQQLGVFSNRSLSQAVTDRFIAAIPTQFRYINICLNTYNQLSTTPAMQTRNLVTYEMDLISGYDDLKKQYSTNTARNIKKAHEAGVFVVPHGKPEDIISAFIRHRGRGINAFSASDYEVLKHLIYAGIHRGIVSIYTAYTAQNNFCAGVVFFHSHHKSIFLFSGADEMAKTQGAMFLLIDSFIRDHAGQPLVLDFEGSMNPGLARFYRGFGSKECVFLQLKINRMPWLIRPVSDLYLWYKQRRVARIY